METENVMDRTLESKADIYKVLGDPNRIRIIEFLRNGERCQCEMIPLLGQSQPAVSRHLSLLEDEGIILSRRTGNRTTYRISDSRILRVIDCLDEGLLRSLTQSLLRKHIAPTRDQQPVTGLKTDKQTPPSIED